MRWTNFASCEQQLDCSREAPVATVGGPTPISGNHCYQFWPTCCCKASGESGLMKGSGSRSAPIAYVGTPCVTLVSCSRSVRDLYAHISESSFLLSSAFGTAIVFHVSARAARRAVIQLSMAYWATTARLKIRTHDGQLMPTLVSNMTLVQLLWATSSCHASGKSPSKDKQCNRVELDRKQRQESMHQFLTKSQLLMKYAWLRASG